MQRVTQGKNRRKTPNKVKLSRERNESNGFLFDLLWKEVMSIGEESRHRSRSGKSLCLLQIKVEFLQITTCGLLPSTPLKGRFAQSMAARPLQQRWISVNRRLNCALRRIIRSCSPAASLHSNPTFIYPLSNLRRSHFPVQLDALLMGFSSLPI